MLDEITVQPTKKERIEAEIERLLPPHLGDNLRISVLPQRRGLTAVRVSIIIPKPKGGGEASPESSP